MGILNFITQFLFVSRDPIIQDTITNPSRASTLEVWLQNSPLDHQPISWYKDTGFAIQLRSPLDSLPQEEIATFLQRPDYPTSLFIHKSTTDHIKRENYIGPVFVRGSGEIGYRQPQLEVGEELYFDNFTTVDFTYWPDKKTYDALDFVPEGAVSGVWFACPRQKGEGGRGVYQLLAMAPMFKEGGCITLDWLVIKDVLNGVVDADDVDVQAATLEAEADL